MPASGACDSLQGGTTPLAVLCSPLVSYVHREGNNPTDPQPPQDHVSSLYHHRFYCSGIF